MSAVGGGSDEERKSGTKKESQKDTKTVEVEKWKIQK